MSYLSYPQSTDEWTRLRFEIINQAITDPTLQKFLFEKCRNDIIFFSNFFLWTFNPKETPFHFPFVLYAAQAEAILEIKNEILKGEGSLTEKSRDTGATYLHLAAYIHFWIFAEGFEALLLSLKEEDVDDRTPSSMFGKIRYMLYKLPFFLMPLKFSRRDHDIYKKLTNPDNGNSIIGRATTEDAGRSARKTVVFVDEYASIPPRLIKGIEVSLQEVTNTIHRCSTPKGINQFKTMRDKGTFHVRALHWTMIPPKCDGLFYIDDELNKRVECPFLPMERRSPYGFYIDELNRVTKYRLRSPWYDKKLKEYPNERDANQELNISYLGSGYCRFSVEMLESKSKFVREGKRGILHEEFGKVRFLETPTGANFEIEIWQFPTEPSMVDRSAIGADVAEGLDKGDYSSADVIIKDLSGTRGNHAASLHGHFSPDVWAEKLDLLGRFYDAGAILAVERNKDGLGVLLNLRNVYEYPNLYSETRIDATGDDEKERLGFYTTDTKKAIITSDLDSALKEGELVTESSNHFSELSTFENINGKLGARGQNFDDRVMSLSIAWHVAKQFGRPREKLYSRKVISRKLSTMEGY